MAIKIQGTTVIDDSRNILNIVDLPVTHGGTGASTASTARNNLGLAIGTNVQAWNTNLDTYAGKTPPSGAIVGTSDTQTLSGKTLSSPSLTGDTSIEEFTETVYNLTGTSIDPANGTIQYKTLTANTTFTEALADGQSVLLRVAAGATYTVTWFTVTWVGGSPPTLTADDVLVFWQEGTTVYGNYLGSVV